MNEVVHKPESNSSGKNSLSNHIFEYRSLARKKLFLSLLVTSLFMIVELIGGLAVNSIALISDAGHMFTHTFAILISLLAAFIAKKPPCHHKTFGLYRAEILAAFVNGLFLILVVVIIIYEAILRILYPVEINSFYMFLVAFLGLAVNLLSIFILRGNHQSDLNVRGVFYHMMADATSSIGIVVVSIVIFYSNWTVLDPLVSIGISMIIFYWAWGIMKDSTRILLEMAPKGMNIDTIVNDLKTNFHEILDIYNVHFWTITQELLIFSAHVILNDNASSNSNIEIISSKINRFLSEKYKIVESTIQIAQKDDIQVCNTI